MANDKIEFIEGVACYVKVHKPYPKYQSEEMEFTIDLIVPKDVAKQWKKDFKKQPPKEFDNDEFKEKFKIDPPFDDQDEQFVIKLKTEAQYKDGKEKEKKYWPRVLVLDDEGVAVDIEQGILVGNGSKVKVSYNTRSNDFGTFAKLKNILVLDLVEFEEFGGASAGSEFGVKVKTNSEFKEDVEKEEKGEAQKKDKAPKPSLKNQEEPKDFEDDSPF